MSKFKYTCFGLAFLLVFSACNRQDSKPASETAQTADTQTAAQVSSPEMPAVQQAVKSGTIKETMNSAGYTYILISDGTTDTWVAVTETKVNVGDEVSYYDGLVMENFQSKTLNKTFDRVVFSGGLVGQQGAGGGLPLGGPTEGASSFSEAMKSEGGAAIPANLSGSMGSKAAIVPLAEIKVDKADGDNAFTISEIFAKSSDLNGKTVRVKGKVVKVTPRVMGLTWLHIQDGTGDAANNSHDLVVTTTSDPQNDWDVVIVEGILAANKDFGAGYKYDVIVEEAQISK